MLRIIATAALFPLILGCYASANLVRPVPRLSVISPELENLTDEKIETYLRADVRPVFPTTVAIARVAPRPWYDRSERPETRLMLKSVTGDEADGWRELISLHNNPNAPLLEQVQFVNALVSGSDPTLKGLRDAAAMLHAPLLFVYMQEDNEQQGYNDAAIAYWSIVGMFVVPGNAVGCHSACQGVLIDTRTGFILATADGDDRREENVFIGAVRLARDRTRRDSQRAAITELQENTAKTVAALALHRGVMQNVPLNATP